MSIGSVNISPFNKLAANDVTVEVAPGLHGIASKAAWCRYNAWQAYFDGRGCNILLPS